MTGGHLFENGDSIRSSDMLEEHHRAISPCPFFLGVIKHLGIDTRYFMLGPPRAEIIGEEIEAFASADTAEDDVLSG
jgi:hypothetical protein